MDIFEVVTLALSFVVGLGMTQMLGAVVGVIRQRKRRAVHWLPLAWAASIFLFHIQYWFAIYDLNQSLDGWTWATFLAVLVLAGILYLSGGLVLPDQSEAGNRPLEDYFREHGRLALVLFATYLLAWVPVDLYVYGGTLVHPGHLPTYALVVLSAVAFVAERRATQVVAYVLFAVIQLYSTIFLWAPAALG